jgi:hypothetical protein
MNYFAVYSKGWGHFMAAFYYHADAISYCNKYPQTEIKEVSLKVSDIVT